MRQGWGETMQLIRNNIEALESEFFRKPGIAGLATTRMGYNAAGP